MKKKPKLSPLWKVGTTPEDLEKSFRLDFAAILSRRVLTMPSLSIQQASDCAFALGIRIKFVGPKKSAPKKPKI